MTPEQSDIFIDVQHRCVGALTQRAIPATLLQHNRSRMHARMTTPTPTPLPNHDEIGTLELFTGLALEQIVVVSNARDAAAALAELSRHAAVGFDTESRPTFHRHQKCEGPHVVQFATPQHAYLFQAHVDDSHAALTELLASSTMAKVGFGLSNDLQHIRHKFSVRPQGVIDLNHVFHEMGHKNCVGARAAIAALFHRRLAKSKRITTSNWSSKTLSAQQVLYAANDAYAALRVFEALAVPRATWARLAARAR
jgi:ribonuclease D